MTTRPSPPMRGRLQARRLLALFALGWLSLVAQPCLATSPAMPAGMQHCDHGGTPGHPAPCLEMQVDHCIKSDDFNFDRLRVSKAPRSAAILSMLPAVPVRQHPAAVAADPHFIGDPTGPPLHIRYRNLRN